MIIKLTNFIFGCSKIKASGTFCERVLNIAKEKGIFVQNIIRTDENDIVFTVSQKGAEELFRLDLGDDISLSEISSFGLGYVFSSHKSRLILPLSPLLLFIFLFLSTQIIWHVNIIGADSDTEASLLSQLRELGVKKGALKMNIKQSEIKDQILISNPEIMWIWVDIRGASAIVKFVPRDMAPEVYTKNEFYNIYSTHDGVITKITPTNGVAKVKVGDTVLKGQLLIEGTMSVSEDEKKYIHASGNVSALVWEEKTVTIPKKTEIRTPTGNKIEHLSINFENFRIKLFINSSILYPNYDIIENNRVFAPFNITFTKTEYSQVTVSYEENDVPQLIKLEEQAFHSELIQNGCTVTHSEYFTKDFTDYVQITMRALCDKPIAAERRMYFGEDNSITNN